MAVDEALLEASASYEDPRLGIREQFVRLQAGPAGTLGVLAAPLGPARSLGWVVCHSFGAEQVDLHMTDVAMARSLAAAGYPTLRFHCQGYGDSDDVSTPPGPSSQLRDTLDVVGQLPELAGVGRVGLVGTRFGGTVAALAADASGASHLLLLHPIVSGAKYATEVLRSRVITEMFADQPSAVTTVEELRAGLDRDGMVNIKGWRLHRDVYEAIRSVDLLKQLERFSGQALVVQVSRGPSPQGPLARLASRLEQLGATARLEVLTHVAAPSFGYEHFRPVEKDRLGDTLEGINQGLSEHALAWLASGEGPTGPVDVP